jgi:hypothetical protein
MIAMISPLITLGLVSTLFSALSVADVPQTASVPAPIPALVLSAPSARIGIMHTGTYEDPKGLDERSDKVDDVYAVIDAGGTRRFYTSRFIGFAGEQLNYEEMPPIPPDYVDYPAHLNDGLFNGSWIYRGVHAGTFSDPKQGCEASYENAIHTAKLHDETQGFFRNMMGLLSVSCWDNGLPDTEVSNTDWAYLATSKTAGTYTHPKGNQTVTDFTWPGAVHLFTFMADDKHRFYAARKEGMTDATWTAPGPNGASNEYWQYLSDYQRGTYGVPKDRQWTPNATWIGAIYISR